MENQAGQANLVPLPSARPIDLVDNVTLQPPLSRRGNGPGLFIMVPKEYRGFSKGVGKRTLDPEPRQKWAEEGFAVVEVRIGSRDSSDIAQHAFNIGLDALRKLPECTSDGGVGIIGKLNCFPVGEVLGISGTLLSDQVCRVSFIKCKLISHSLRCRS